MANTIGWGKATQNNDNGFGKYQNTIGAASIYAESYAGETAVVGTSAAFSYSASTFTQADADPTPTITGTAGGFFTSDAGVSFIDTSTGQIDLSASTIATHAITYIVDGVQSTQNVGIESAPYQSTRSFSFDGTDDYFYAPVSALNSSTVFSVSMWFKLATNSSILILGDIITTNLSGFSFSYDGYWSTVRFRTMNGANSYTDFSLSGDTNWHHFVAVFESDSNKIFHNGSLVSSSTAAQIPTTMPATFGNDFKIGSDSSPSEVFGAGDIDEVSIWDSALSSDAITEIYNSGAPNDLESLTNASSSNLVAWYKMGE